MFPKVSVNSFLFSNDTSLIFWHLIAKDDHFLNAIVKSHFWLHIVSHFQFLTRVVGQNFLSRNARISRLKCTVDLMVLMLKTGKTEDWPDIFDETFFSTVTNCLADLLFNHDEQNEEQLPIEVVWLLLQLTALLSYFFPKRFPETLAHLCRDGFPGIATQLVSLLRQPPSEAVFKSAVSATSNLFVNNLEKLAKATKRLKLSEINVLFNKVASNLTALLELEWDELLFTSLCQLLFLLFDNERCSTSIRQTSLHVTLPKTSAESCMVRDLACRQGNLSTPPPPPKEDDCLTMHNILLRALQYFHQEIKTGNRLVRDDVEIAALISRLIEKLKEFENSSFEGFVF